MVATLEPLRQLPTMPESQSQSQSQCSSSSSPCQACALIMSTRARWEKCAATVAPAPSPQPCTGGKPTHAFLFLHSPRASKSLFCVLLIFSWPRICFHLRFSIAASIVLKPPCARTSSIPLPSSMWPKTTRGFRFSRDVGKRGKKRNRNTIEKSKKRQRRRRTQRLGIRATLSRTPEH